MADAPRMTLSTTVLDAPDPAALAEFYRRLLGWKTVTVEPEWVLLRSPDESRSLSFQLEPYYQRPTWPGKPGEQGMMMHLDIEVDDLTEAGAYAVEQGATLADFQPQKDVRVYYDPAGHPFCLWTQP
jgi:catechol 2,3-dioxygenase-like lactoylglutathione lyase family enzyme